MPTVTLPNRGEGVGQPSLDQSSRHPHPSQWNRGVSIRGPRVDPPPPQTNRSLPPSPHSHGPTATPRAPDGALHHGGPVPQAPRGLVRSYRRGRPPVPYPLQPFANTFLCSQVLTVATPPSWVSDPFVPHFIIIFLDTNNSNLNQKNQNTGCGSVLLDFGSVFFPTAVDACKKPRPFPSAAQESGQRRGS